MWGTCTHLARADRRAYRRRETNVGQGRDANVSTGIVSALRRLGDTARFGAGTDALMDLLSCTVAALEHREDATVTLTLIEDRLDTALPGVTARFGITPALSLGADNESL